MQSVIAFNSIRLFYVRSVTASSSFVEITFLVCFRRRDALHYFFAILVHTKVATRAPRRRAPQHMDFTASCARQRGRLGALRTRLGEQPRGRKTVCARVQHEMQHAPVQLPWVSLAAAVAADMNHGGVREIVG